MALTSLLRPPFAASSALLLRQLPTVGPPPAPLAPPARARVRRVTTATAPPPLAPPRRPPSSSPPPCRLLLRPSPSGRHPLCARPIARSPRSRLRSLSMISDGGGGGGGGGKTSHNDDGRAADRGKSAAGAAPPEDELDALFANYALFPPPTGDALRSYGVPLLARAAHHARVGRTLCYDSYEHHHDHRRHPISHPEEKGGAAGGGAGGRGKVRRTYAEVLEASSAVHRHIVRRRSSDPKPAPGPRPPPRPRVAFLCHPGSAYIACQWGSWSSGSVSVPLCTIHRRKELQYVLEDCDPDIVIDGTRHQTGHGDDGEELRSAAEAAGMADRVVGLEEILVPRPQEGAADYELGAGGDLVPTLDAPASILYTSGTTGPPKGVVTTHRNIYHQVTDLVLAWGWTSNDAILHMLPLHHVHGIINKLCCAVWAGASMEFMRFHPRKVWERLGRRFSPAGGVVGPRSEEDDENHRRPLTLFMAVPTIYAKLLEALPTLPEETLPEANAASLQRSVRLCVSGSAALPASIFKRWYELTGQTILERYGMTEFAMALSNPLHPVEGRIPGYVGMPLPSVEVRIVDEDTGEVIPNAPDVEGSKGHHETATDEDDPDRAHTDRSGELLVRGPTVFSEYWNKPHATAESFDFDGYFRTGDVAEYDPRRRSYHILGRVSADIIKSGGHKLSSLQIERTLLEHPHLEEVVVLGVPDEVYGERVGLICRMRADPKTGNRMEDMTLEELREWCRERMAPYKVPTRLLVMREDVPKNAMGKVSKRQLVSLFEKGG